MHSEHIVSFPAGKDEGRAFVVEMAGITYPDKDYHIYREKSELFCMEYVLSGYGHVTIDRVSFSVGPGDIYILPLDRRHDYYADANMPYEKIWFNIHGALIPALLHAYGLEGVYHVRNAQALKEQFFRFLTICENRELSAPAICEACSLQWHRILIELQRLIHEEEKDTSVEYRVKEYIDRRVYEGTTREELESYAKMSYSQIVRRFKAKYELTPHGYMRVRRMETARRLLHNTNLSIKEIAYKMNFSDEHYFSNVFKQHYGISPRKDRLNT